MAAVLIADGNTRLSGLLAELLADEPDLSVAGVCSSAEAAVATVGASRLDVVLVGERLADGSGRELCSRLRELRPALVLLQWSHDPAGAASYPAADALLELGMTFGELVRAIRGAVRARSGQPVVPEAPAPPPSRVLPVEAAGDLEARPGHLLLRCHDCGLDAHIENADMSSAVVQARAFFLDHDGCQTTVGLARTTARPDSGA